MEQSLNSLINSLLNKRSRRFSLSDTGYMGQGKDAAGSDINASVGIALDEAKEPLVVDSLLTQITGEKKDLLYSSSYGEAELRDLWTEEIIRKNPGLRDALFSTPVVCSGLSHGLNIAGNLFLGKKEPLILTQPVYDNYQHMLGGFFESPLCPVDFYGKSGFNLSGLDKMISSQGEALRILLNFPNNPLGYSLRKDEAEDLKTLLLKHCQAGKKILLILDDAYFGLFYEDNLLKESLFGFLADLHENLLLVKIDGFTKEYFAWGMRIGFISFQSKGKTKEDYRQLENRAAAIIRSTVSNVSRVNQSAMIRVMKSPDIQKEKQENDTLLAQRYKKVKEILNKHREYEEYYIPEPFNSGYFFSLRLLHDLSADYLRKKLREKSIGVLSPTEKHIRLAYSSVSLGKLEELLEIIYITCKEIVNK